MRRKFKLLTLIAFFIPLTTLSSSASTKPGDVSISLSTKHDRYVLQKNNDWFEVSLDISIRNEGNTTIVICDTEAYSIFPPLYVIRVNGRTARAWSGDLMCAPMFTEGNKVKLAPGEVYHGTVSWNLFVENFEQKAGRYKIAVKYDLDPKSTNTLGASSRGLTRVESSWSNTVEIEIVRELSSPN